MKGQGWLYLLLHCFNNRMKEMNDESCCYFNAVVLRSFKNFNFLLKRSGFVDVYHRCTLLWWRLESGAFGRLMAEWGRGSSGCCRRWSAKSSFTNSAKLSGEKNTPQMSAHPSCAAQQLCLFQSLSFYFYFWPTLMAHGLHLFHPAPPNLSCW